MNKAVKNIYILLMKEGYKVAECKGTNNVYRIQLFYYSGAKAPARREPGESPAYTLRKREFWLEPRED